MRAFFYKYRSFILYILIGFTGLALDMLTFTFLTRGLNLHEQLANPISMSVGITNNFFVNAYLNFKKTDHLLERFSKFYLVGIVGIVVSNLILWLFNDLLGGEIQQLIMLIIPILEEYRLEIVKAGSIVIIAIMQYFLNKKITFNDKNEN